MIQNYFKIAWRTLRAKPLFTLLNTVGLSIGVTGIILIGLYLHDEYSFDKSYPDANRIYRVNIDLKFGDYEKDFSTSPAILGPTLAQDYEDVAMSTRFRQWGSMLIKRPEAKENLKVESTTYVDPSFVEMFGFKLLQGNPKTCLEEPNTLILTESVAKSHFGTENAIGKSLLLDNQNIYRVTGVIQDMPKKSFLRDFGIFMSMASHEASENPVWSNYNFPTFIKLNENVTKAGFDPKLQSIFDNYNLPAAQENDPTASKESFEKEGNYLRYSLLPVSGLHLSSNRSGELSPNNDKQDVYILFAIGLFLIVLACINFINLSTAQSLKRAKEVGIRKTLGSNKRSLIFQFLAESVLVSFGAVVLALVAVSLLFSNFNNLAAKQLDLPFVSPSFWFIAISSTLLLGILAGIYPAFFMTNFQPVKVLKGRDSKARGGKIRSSLVVFQFTISIFLIISTLVVYQQLGYMQGKNLGYEKDQRLIIYDTYTLGNKSEAFKKRIKNLNGVEMATFSSYLPTYSNRSDSGFELLGSDDQEKIIQLQCWRVQHDYAETMEFKMASGRDFDDNYATDSTGILLNEKAVSLLNLTPEEVLGMKIRKLDEADNEAFTVLGVVKDFHFDSFKSEIEPLSFIQRENLGSMVVKLKSGDFQTMISQIEAEWKSTVVGEPFNYGFMDEEFAYTFAAEQRLGQIFLIFALLSIGIACLGLFGLATFNAEKRIKEIGIRKVMGASVSQVTGLLTYDFLKLVVISILIASPLGWYAMRNWLTSFTYRIDISIGLFLYAAGLAVLISVVTVSYQAIKAAITNPVESLKSE